MGKTESMVEKSRLDKFPPSTPRQRSKRGQANNGSQVAEKRDFGTYPNNNFTTIVLKNTIIITNNNAINVANVPTISFI